NARWCDSLSGLTGNGPSGGQSGGGVDALGISYTPVYKSEGSVNIMYNESSLSLGKDALGYRIILSERINGKTEFVVVENGKEIARGSKVPEQHLGKGIGWDMGLEDNGTKSLSTTMDPHIV